MEVTTRQAKKGPPQSSTCSPRKVLYYTNKAAEMGPLALSAITKLHPIKSGPWEGCCRNTLKSAWNYRSSQAQFCSSNKNSHVSPSTFTPFLQDTAVYHMCLQACGHHAYGETGCSFTSCSLTIPKNIDGLQHRKWKKQAAHPEKHRSLHNAGPRAANYSVSSHPGPGVRYNMALSSTNVLSLTHSYLEKHVSMGYTG